MHPYTKALHNLYSRNANPAKARPMKAYMRDQFEYLGIQSPQLAELNNSFYAKYGFPKLGELETIFHDLWNLPEREFQYAGVGLLSRMENDLPAKYVKIMEYLLVTKSWWDTVDSIAGGTVGVHFQRYPKVKEKSVARWRYSDNLWLRRTTLLFQLAYKEDTDFDLLCDLIRDNLGSREFFINKAIGWALRQYSRVDPDGVRKFVDETPLQPLSQREALKWLERKKKQ